MENTNRFDVPVCLFTYQRKDTVERIVEVLRQVRVSKLYLLSDQGKTDEVKARVQEVREFLKTSIDWDCEVIYDFAEENRGVFKNIGLGAVNILRKERYCIFIEDDNLPDPSFFPYCKELLEKYENDPKIYMICGTNYGEKTNYSDDSYYIVKALLPCGWASWSNKFEKHYDQTLEKFDDKKFRKEYIKKYHNKALAKQQLESIMNERKRYLDSGSFRSWDYHMIASLMNDDLLVISPKVNLIRNIGIDDLGTHNHKKKTNLMTERFCEIPTHTLKTPLIHPKEIQINKGYQKYCDKVILLPFWFRVKHSLALLKNKLFKK